MTTRAIADITRNYAALDEATVTTIKKLLADAKLPMEALTVVAKETQRRLIENGLPGAQTLFVPHMAVVAGQVHAMVQADTATKVFILVSYSGAVLNLERQEERVHSLTFGRVRAGEGATLAPATESSIPVSTALAAPAAEVSKDMSGEVTVPQQYRSRLMGDALKRQRLGPFSKHRIAVYGAIEAVMRERPGLTVSELLDAAVAQAKASAAVGGEGETEAEAEAEASGDTKRDLWPIVRKFIEHLLTEARVLLAADGTPIGRDWNTAFAPVASLAPDWQAAADGRLVLGVLAEFDDVSLADLKNLARVLCFTADAGSQKRALDAVAYLLKQQIVTQSDGHLKKSDAAAQEPERMRILRPSA